MRHSWRLLLSRNYPRPSPKFSKSPHHFHFYLHSSSPTLSSLRSISSFHALTRSHFTSPVNSLNPPIPRYFSSEPLAELIKETDHHLVISDVFTKYTDLNDVSKELEANGIVLSHGVMLRVLKSLYSKPEVARRFFNWVSERDGGKLCSKGYNLMLGSLGSNGLAEEFWEFVEVMKGKGYGISSVTRDRVMERFEKDGLESDVERLKGVFASGSVDSSVEKVGAKVSRIVRNRVWGDDVEEEIRGLGVEFSSEVVKAVLENMPMEPMKGLIFFRWAEEMVKHDKRTYNAMARLLGREDCIDRFWKVVDEMRNNGYEMEVETYSKVLGRFVKRKMMKEAVDLCEFAMAGANKPSIQCCTFLLKKIAAAKELDIALFSRVVKIFTKSGNVLTDSMLNAVLKSLTSVGRFGDCNKVLKEMKDGGLIVSGNMQSKIAFSLSQDGKKDETSEFIDHIEALGSNLDEKAWVSLVEGHCISGDLEKASDYFQKMVKKIDSSNTGYTFDYLVNAYCSKNRALDVCKLLHDSIGENQFKPWHTTYKLLIKKLLVQGGFNEALNLFHVMKNQGYPPYVNPFFEYISKSGMDDDAIAFMKAMTSKKFPSTSVVLRVFQAFFRAGRYDDAQNLLSKCPGHIRSQADVLNLFSSMQCKKDAAQAAA